MATCGCILWLMSGAVYYVKHMASIFYPSSLYPRRGPVRLHSSRDFARTAVIDLSNPPVHAEADSTIDLAEEP